VSARKERKKKKKRINICSSGEMAICIFYYA
jgi:hypothetical protein